VSTAGAKGQAFDAAVDNSGMADQRARDHAQQVADDAEHAVKTIETKLAGMKESLATAKADAKRLRAEAQKGGQG
jgi:uncharacterized protein YceH (UPF0502 family)